MSAVRRRLLLAVLPLVAAGCRRAEVTAYRIPAEKDPDLGAAAPMAAAGADSTNGAAVSQPTTAAPAPAGGAPVAPMPAMASMANTAVPVAEGPSLVWTAPAAWQSRAPGAMRKATYILPGDGAAPAELSITAFPSDVGGELANVNRWRGQVQQPPLDAAGLDAAVLRWSQAGLQLTFVDCAGSSQRILGAIVPYNGGTWFFKLTGANAVLAREKPAFLAFLRSIHPAQP